MDTTVPGSRARAWLYRIVAVLLAVTVLLLLGEGAARVVAGFMGKGRALVFDPELGWRPLPNLARVAPHWGIHRPARTNSHGWRDVEHDLRKPEGARRALLLGDSFAFGLYVDDGERVSELIAQPTGLEVVNMGITGWGTDQQLRALETNGFDYSPDIVILLAFPSNDLDDIRLEQSSSWPKPHYDLVDGELRLRRPEQTWCNRLRSISYCAEFVYQMVRTKEIDDRIAPGWQGRDTIPLYTAIVRRMADQCKAKGIRLLAIIAYPAESVANGPSEREHRARAALEEAGFATCDTLDAFRERTKAGESLYAGDAMHWNVRGNAVAAEEARKALARLGWVQ